MCYYEYLPELYVPLSIPDINMTIGATGLGLDEPYKSGGGGDSTNVANTHHLGNLLKVTMKIHI